MKAFPDISFLCSLYRLQIHSPVVVEWMKQHHSLPVSTFLLLEFRQSVRYQNRLFSLDRKKGFSPSEGATMLRNLQTDLTTEVLEIVSVDWTDVHRIAEELSTKHTLSGGHRLADIHHVATALHLASPVFLTFDENQKKLAEAEDMSVPV
jgi:predicted nucleic acid-binding protein